MSYSEVIDASKIEELFGFPVSEKCEKLLFNLNLKYRYLTDDERDAHILAVINYLKQEILPAGISRKNAWEKGWGQNLDDFIKFNLDVKNLLPYYYRNGRSIMRLQGRYILPEDPFFESKFLEIFYIIISEQYLDKYVNIYELGAGPCHNIIGFAKNLKSKVFHTTDWVSPTIKITELLEANKNKFGFSTHSFSSSIFDYFEPDHKLKLKSNSVALTFGSLEQIGKKFEFLLDYLMMQDEVEILHIEPFLECYKKDILFDQLGLLYSQKRGYLEGYLERLNTLSLNGLIEIKPIKKILGSAYHDGWTILTWKKLKKNDASIFQYERE